MAARTRFFRARSLILSPSKRSIDRHALPPRPALKSLSGSGRRAPWEKVSFTLSLWALPTAIIPSRDHTGLPIHFHSSIISGSAWRMFLRMLANVLPRQSVSCAISWSIRSDGFIGSYTSNSCPDFLDSRQNRNQRPHVQERYVGHPNSVSMTNILGHRLHPHRFTTLEPAETGGWAFRYRTAWRTRSSAAASRRTSRPRGQPCVQSAFRREGDPEH